MTDITYNSAGEPLPWEGESMQEPANLCKPVDPLPHTLAWMKIHLKEYILLRSGLTYKPELTGT